jgi:hypothetical protein
MIRIPWNQMRFSKLYSNKIYKQKSPSISTRQTICFLDNMNKYLPPTCIFSTVKHKFSLYSYR